MKIVIDARLYGLENAGLGRYVINLVHELEKLDRKNRYIILLRKKYFKTLKFPKNWKKVETDYRHYSFSEQFILPFILYREKPDIVHFPHFNVPLLYFGKFVVTIHDMLMHKYKGASTTTLAYPLYIVKRLAYLVVFYKAVKSSYKIIVPSQTVKKELSESYLIKPGKIIRIYEGYSRITFTGKAEEDDLKLLKKYNLKRRRYLIYAGNAYPHKNLEFSIRGFLEYQRINGGDLKFLIISPSEYFIGKLRNYLSKLNPKNDIQIHGFVEDEEYKVLLRNSLAYLYPSLSEGFGLQGIESLASRTLLLASDIPVFREIYGKNAYYFNPQKIESLISAIGSLVTLSENQRPILTKKGMGFVSRYSWEKMAEQTHNVYLD